MPEITGKNIGPNGPVLNVGNPGNKGGTGRPKDEWKRALQAFTSRDETLKHVESVLNDGPSHPFFFKALDYCTEHGFGKPDQSTDVTSGGQPLGKVLLGISVEDDI